MFGVLAGCSARVPGANTGAPASTASARLETQLDEAMRLTERGYGVAGIAVGVWLKGQPLLVRGYGLADVLQGVPVRTDHIFRIGSITKTFTAVAIARLAAQQKLSITDPVARHLPALGLDKRITLRHLLSHTSGIPSYTELPSHAEQMHEALTAAQLLAQFAGLPLKFEPGSEHAYSNSGYYLLGLVIEKVSGQSYADFLRTEAYAPAGLTETGYCPDAQNYPDAALGYVRTSGALGPARPLSMTQPFAAGALCSSANDLLRWFDALSHGKLVSAEAYAAMSAPTELNSGQRHNYGLGLSIGDLEGHARVGHSGGINGFATDVSYYPRDELLIVVLVNTEGSPPSGIVEKLARIVLDLQEPSVLDLPITAEEAAPVTGSYEVRELGQLITIFLDGDHLRLGRAGQPGGLRLRSQGNGIYAVPELDARLNFELEGGEVKRMIVRQRGQRFIGQRK